MSFSVNQQMGTDDERRTESYPLRLLPVAIRHSIFPTFNGPTKRPEEKQSEMTANPFDSRSDDGNGAKDLVPQLKAFHMLNTVELERIIPHNCTKGRFYDDLEEVGG